MILYSIKLTIVGMTTVFLFLILLGFVISLFGKFFRPKRNGQSAAAAAAIAVHKTRS